MLRSWAAILVLFALACVAARLGAPPAVFVALTLGMILAGIALFIAAVSFPADHDLAR